MNTISFIYPQVLLLLFAVPFLGEICKKIGGGSFFCYIFLSFFVLGLSSPIYKNYDYPQSFNKAVIIVENDWKSAENINQIENIVSKISKKIIQQKGKVFIIPTALSKELIFDKASDIKAMPLKNDFSLIQKATDKLKEKEIKNENVSVFWITSGINIPNFSNISNQLQTLGELNLLIYTPKKAIKAIKSVNFEKQSLSVTTIRSDKEQQAENYQIKLLDKDFKVIKSSEYSFAEKASESAVNIEKPADKEVAAVKISNNAGGVFLLGRYINKQQVYFVEENKEIKEEISLLSADFFLKKVLSPMSEFTKEISKAKVIVSHNYICSEDIKKAVEKGATLISFIDKEDKNNPFSLKFSSVSKFEPAVKIKSSEQDSLFAGIDDIDNVLIKKIVFFDEEENKDIKVLARLENEMPYIISKKEGQGKLILFLSPIDYDWQNLHLTYSFPKIMEKLLKETYKTPQEKEYKLISEIMAEGKLIKSNKQISFSEEDVKNTNKEAPFGYYGNNLRLEGVNLSGSINEIKTINKNKINSGIEILDEELLNQEKLLKEIFLILSIIILFVGFFVKRIFKR